jgi:hypothetical protein
MNCDWVQQNVTLYLYGELADDARHEVEQHIARCSACAVELAEQRQFQEAMSVLPVQEISPSFLAASRMRLQEALEHVQPHRSCITVLPSTHPPGFDRYDSPRHWPRSSFWSDSAAASAPCTRQWPSSRAD